MTRSAPSPPGARLAAVLRELKDRTGLSLAQLADATTFSKSSWQRYLNGGSLPPRSAVVELCRLAGEPADRPLALLDIARTDRTSHDPEPATTEPPVPPVPQGSLAGEGTGSPPETAPPATAPTDTTASGTALTAPAPADTAPTHPASAPHRRTTLLTALASLLALTLALGALVLLHLPPPHRDQAQPAPTPAASTTGPLCRHRSCQGKDPLTTRCGAGPETLAEHETATGAWIQIRYNPVCEASWARMWGADLGDRVEFRAGGTDGRVHGARVTNRTEADTYVHTLMSVVDLRTSLQACFVPAVGGPKECFGAVAGVTTAGTAP
ncbi:helix-turn-helix domain-containing protein [Streptomyces longwoodensis]|uniref:helix-turn-helix domain-containing protein n=1 Tax=Streptomyces longwoodensis TaxID=68231 RepID=UPI0033F04B7E